MRKPNRWGVNPGLTERPELWRCAHNVLPFWTVNQVDLQKKVLLTKAGDPALTAASIGQGVALDGTGDWYLHPNRTLGSRLALSTLTFVYRSSSTAAVMCLFGVFNTGTNTGIQLQLNADGNETLTAGSIRAFLRSDDDTASGLQNDTGAVGATDGETHVISFLVDKAARLITIIFDGVDVTTAGVSNDNGVSFADFGFDPAFGARNVRGTVSQPYTGDLFFAATHNLRLPDALVIDWHKDIMAMIREETPVVGFVPAAVAGRIMSSLVGSGGLVHHGGIAGQGGGLAG